MLRRITWGLLVLAIVSLAVAVVGVHAIARGWQRERVRDWVERSLSDALDTPVRIGAIEGPLYDAFEISDLRVETPALAIASLRVQIGGFALKAPHLVVESIAIEGVTLTLEADTATTETVEEEPGPPPEWLPTLVLRRASLRSARVVLTRGDDVVAADAEADLGAWTLLGPDADALPDRIAGTIALDPASRLSGRPIESGSARFALEGGALEVSELELLAGPTRLSGHGATRIAPWLAGAIDPEARLELRFSALDPVAFGAPARFASELSGTLRISPDAELPERNAWLAEGRLDPGRLPIGAIDGGEFRARYREPLLSVEQLVVEGPDLRLQASGSVDPDALHDVRVEGALPLQRLATLLDAPLSGDARLDLSVSGSFDGLQGSVGARVAGFGYDARQLGDLALTARSSGPGRFTLEELSLEGDPSLRLAAPAQVRLGRGTWSTPGARLTGPLVTLDLKGGVGADGFDALEVRCTQLDLVELARLLEAPGPTGQLDANLVLRGPLANPRVEGDFRGRALQIEGIELRALEARITSRDDQLAAEGELDAGARGRAKLRGHVARVLALNPGAWSGDPRTRLEIDAEALDLATLAPWLPADVSDPSGHATAQIRLRGSAPRPAVEGRISLHEARLSVAALDAQLYVARGDLDVRGDAVTIDDWEVEVLLPPATDGAEPELLARFALGGSVSEDRLRKLQVRAQDLDARRLGRLLGTPTALGGKLEFDLAFDGPIAAPLASGSLDWRAPRLGTVALDALALQLQPDTAALHATLDLQLGGSRILWVEAELPREFSPADAGTLLSDPRFRASLVADGTDLGVLAPLLPVTLVDPAGRASGRVQLQGAAGGPRVDGWLEVHEAGVRARVLGERLEPIEGRFRFEGDRVVVEHMAIQQTEGRAQLDGSLALFDPSQSARLALRFEDFAVRRPPLLQTRIFGDTTLSGSLAEPLVEGDLRFERLDVHVPPAGNRALKEIRIVAGPERPDDPTRISEDRESSEWWLATRIDVRAEVAPGARVEGSGAVLRVEGVLRIEKQRDGEIHYTGGAEVTQGNYTIHGRRFEVETGQAALTGGTEVDPFLNVEATTRVRDVKLIVRITGPASNPKVAFDGVPPMPESEVLSYLLFGRASGELGVEQQQAVSTAALSYAAGMASQELSGILRRVGIDTFDVRPGADGTTTQVGVTKYISERGSLRYGTGLGAEAESEVEVEVQLTPSISVRSSMGSGGSAGADVIWSRDY